MPLKAPSPEPSGTFQDVPTQAGERAFPPTSRADGQTISSQEFLALGQCSVHSGGPVPQEGRAEGTSCGGDTAAPRTGQDLWAPRQSPTCQPQSQDPGVSGAVWTAASDTVPAGWTTAAAVVEEEAGESTVCGDETPVWRGGDHGPMFYGSRAKRVLTERQLDPGMGRKRHPVLRVSTQSPCENQARTVLFLFNSETVADDKAEMRNQVQTLPGWPPSTSCPCVYPSVLGSSCPSEPPPPSATGTNLCPGQAGPHPPSSCLGVPSQWSVRVLAPACEIGNASLSRAWCSEGAQPPPRQPRSPGPPSDSSALTGGVPDDRGAGSCPPHHHGPPPHGSRLQGVTAGSSNSTKHLLLHIENLHFPFWGRGGFPWQFGTFLPPQSWFQPSQSWGGRTR